ncbi:WASH complex subunit strumpellin [Sarcoptes scabiei]|nr:WASH complex subunit strumpellin [Sarcoptes scabiei]
MNMYNKLIFSSLHSFVRSFVYSENREIDADSVEAQRQFVVGSVGTSKPRQHCQIDYHLDRLEQQEKEYITIHIHVSDYINCKWKWRKPNPSRLRFKQTIIDKSSSEIKEYCYGFYVCKYQKFSSPKG